MSKVSENFKQVIKNYLDNRAAEDELFALTYKKENKSLEECCNYIMNCAKDNGCAGYSDEEVFGWAVHYYDEDDIKNIKPISGKVVVNHSVDLTEEEKEEAKQKAINSLIEETKEEARGKISETIELTEEDIKLAKAKAIDKMVIEEREKLNQKAQKKKSNEKGKIKNKLASKLVA
jgi:hypothetical protein